MPSYNAMSYDTEFLTPILADYPAIKKVNVLNIVQNLITAMDELGYKQDYVLDCMEYYFAGMIKRNIANKLLVQKINKDIMSVQQAKKQTDAYIKPQLILENLFSLFC